MARTVPRSGPSSCSGCSRRGRARAGLSERRPAAVALALCIWGHLHGLVSLEIYGHLLTQTLDPDKLYREELAQLVRSLGLATRH
ncbi:TetR-like C-terminal domain-containing protein [Streptomyces sp. 7N604]|uniref:TetR-like C-terminal domain-containing protein n=1 Tax=Streptomyces sp. 7N604 TaxID=3457415 RepID=UPI003FD51CA5